MVEGVFPITNTASEPALATYTLPLPALKATPDGKVPTGMVSTTTLFLSITNTNLTKDCYLHVAIARVVLLPLGKPLTATVSTTTLFSSITDKFLK